MSSNPETQDSVLPETREEQSLGHSFFFMPVWEPESKGRDGRAHEVWASSSLQRVCGDKQLRSQRAMRSVLEVVS